MEVKDKAPELLLVEDFEEDAILTMRALKKYNLANEIKWVADGEEAIDFLFAKGKYENRQKENTPTIILLDLKLPKIHGLDVLEAIKKDSVLSHIPIIIMTSSKENEDIEKAYALGANSYVVKPVDFQQFAEAVKEIGIYWLILNEVKK